MSKQASLTSFALGDELTIIDGKGGLPFLKIDNQYASALISIYGAQILSYIHKNGNADQSNTETETESKEKDLLFVSKAAYFEPGKEIKGGVPICWPWFAKDPEYPDRKMHGFARSMLWQLDETSSTSAGETIIILSLSDSEETYKLWPHEFKLIATIKIGKTLDISLQTINTGKSNFKITQALHTYFSLTDIDQARVEGLDDTNYLDKVTGAKKIELQLDDDIRVNGEVDRIYIDSPSQLYLFDEKLEREVSIKSSGSKTTVVWNPWIQISKNSADLEDDSYKHFICVETANAADEIVVIEPNDSYKIEAEYSVS